MKRVEGPLAVTTVMGIFSPEMILADLLSRVMIRGADTILLRPARSSAVSRRWSNAAPLSEPKVKAIPLAELAGKFTMYDGSGGVARPPIGAEVPPGCAPATAMLFGNERLVLLLKVGVKLSVVPY